MTATARQAQTPREKLIASTNAEPLLSLAEALVMLCAKPNLDEAERLVRATIIGSIAEKCPAADDAWGAWAESDDDRSEVEVIVAAVLASA
jgi:hypothetical protein